MSTYERRGLLELGGIVLFTPATFAVAIAIVVGMPVVALHRSFSSGMTNGGVAWGVLGFGWLAVVANAAIRNRETRGWLTLLLIGWVAVVVRAVLRVLGFARDDA
jgi:hypothetical protein